MVVNQSDKDINMGKAAQLNPRRAAPAIAMGLPPSAVSLGVQEAERHQIHASDKLDAVGSKDLPVGHLPSGGPFYSLKPLGNGSNAKTPIEVNYSE